MKKCVYAAILIIFLCSQAFALNLDAIDGDKSAPAAGAVNPVTECQDDPRLVDLNSIIAEAKQGPLAQKLMLTPERFASLRPQIIQAIGDGNILICPDISIVAGIPSQAVPVDFFTLLKKYEWAMRSNDQNEIQRLRNTFTVNPLPVQAAASLGTVVRGGTAEAMLWANALQIKPREDRDNKLILYIDLFHAMGGQMEGDPSKIYVLVSSYSTSTRPEIVSILVDKYENKGKRKFS
jgi:hypothetical protein